MRRIFTFIALLSGIVVVTLAVPSGAQTTSTTTTTATTTTLTPTPSLTVTGSATCSTSKGYTITWTLANTSQTTVEFMGGELSGAATGPVEFSPSVINPGASMVGSATVAGTTKGTVTIMVSTLIGNGGSADYTGSVQLAGTCTQAAPAPAAQAQATFTG